MTVARTAAEVLDGHVTLEVESIDRMYLNLYQPQLQRELGVVGFFKERGFAFASGAVMQPITNAFLANIKTFVDDHGVDLVRFKAGERKDDIAQGYLEASDGSEQILFVGVAQEKARLWTTEKRRNPETGASYPWLGALPGWSTTTTSTASMTTSGCSSSSCAPTSPTTARC